MTRMSKQGKRRNQSPRKRHFDRNPTGPKKDNLPLGFKEHVNAVEGELAAKCYIPKIG